LQSSLSSILYQNKRQDYDPLVINLYIPVHHPTLALITCGQNLPTRIARRLLSILRPLPVPLSHLKNPQLTQQCHSYTYRISHPVEPAHTLGTPTMGAQ
jgi:hypothetical protein